MLGLIVLTFLSLKSKTIIPKSPKYTPIALFLLVYNSITWQSVTKTLIGSYLWNFASHCQLFFCLKSPNYKVISLPAAWHTEEETRQCVECAELSNSGAESAAAVLCFGNLLWSDV